MDILSWYNRLEYVYRSGKVSKKVKWTVALSVIGLISLFIIINSIQKREELQRDIEDDLAHNFEVYENKLDSQDIPKGISVEFASKVYDNLLNLNHHLGILPDMVLEWDKNNNRKKLEIEYYTENFIKYLGTIELQAKTEKEQELKKSILKLKSSSSEMAENILANMKNDNLDQNVNKDFLKVQEDAMEVSTLIFNDGLTKYYIRLTYDSMDKPFNLNDSKPTSFLSKDSKNKFNPYLATYTVLKKDTLNGLEEEEPTFTPSTSQSTSTGTNSKYEPSIGMTDYETVDSTWGKPNRINKTETIDGIKEQWVYDRGYLYFEDHYLTSIQTSR